MEERACGIDRQHAPRHQAEQPSGSRRMSGIARGGTPSMRAGRMPAAFRTASASSICAASSRRQRRSASSRARAAGRHSALSALLRLSSSLPHSTPAMSAMLGHARARHVERVAQAGHAGRRSGSCRWWRDGSGAAAPSPRVCTTLKGTMPGDDARAWRRGARAARRVADAVLQADDDRVGRRVAAISSAISAVAPLLTVTRMISAPAKAAAGSVASVERRRRQACGRRRRGRRCAGHAARWPRPAPAAAAASRRGRPAPGSRPRSSRCCRRRQRRCARSDHAIRGATLPQPDAMRASLTAHGHPAAHRRDATCIIMHDRLAK